MKEIIFYGRGGQGAVTASKWFVLAALFEDKYAHAIPSFGQERKGAPVFTHARIDKDPVSTKSFVYQPDCAVVFDHHLPDIGVDYSQGIKGEKILVLNIPEGDIKEPGNSFLSAGYVDATSLTREILGPYPANAAMLGALAATTGWISIESVCRALEKSISGRRGMLNVRAAKEAYERTAVKRSE